MPGGSKNAQGSLRGYKNALGDPRGVSRIRNAVASPFGRILKNARTRLRRDPCIFQNSPKQTCIVTLQMFTGKYGVFTGKSECGDFKFTGIACYLQSL